MHSTVEHKRNRRPAKTLAQLYQRFRRVIHPNSTAEVGAKHATRIAVLGLYRSGSSAVAGILHHLGVNMGPPFYQNVAESTFHEFYESAWLSQQLRTWWSEPEITEKIRAAKRVRVFKRWIQNQERNGSKWIGMKHPLLCLCGPDLLQAWGQSMRFIWAWRPLDNSINSLVRLNWWTSDKSEQSQRTLWTATTKFFADREHLRIDFAAMMADPRQQVVWLIDYLGLEPTENQIVAAINYIQPTSKA
jgi:hypothetical protein